MKTPSLVGMDTMSLDFLRNLEFAGMSPETLADCSYALSCCRFPASVGDSKFHSAVEALCDKKMAQLPCSLSPSAHNDSSLLSPLVRRHALASEYYADRRREKMETFTRGYQWRIVDEMITHDAGSPLARLLLLAECLEADNHARHLGLPYTMGERLTPFDPSLYPDDETLTQHIRSLASKPTHLSREHLIGIADHIQTHIAATGKTAGHLELVNAILNTGMPCFNYPVILREFEKATLQLAKTNSKTRIELALAYSTLWTLTLKPAYLSRFEKTVRHCYYTLAKDKTYPGLGIDIRDPRSLDAALRFLSANTHTLHLLNPSYDLTPLLRKYRP